MQHLLRQFMCLSVSSSVSLENVNFLYPSTNNGCMSKLLGDWLLSLHPWHERSLWFVKHPFLLIVADVFSPFPSIYFETLQPSLLLLWVSIAKKKSQHDWRLQWFHSLNSLLNCAKFDQVSSKTKWSELLSTFIVVCFMCVYFLKNAWEEDNV